MLLDLLPLFDEPTGGGAVRRPPHWRQVPVEEPVIDDEEALILLLI